MEESAHYLCPNAALKETPAAHDPAWDIAQKASLADAVTGDAPVRLTTFQILRDDRQAKIFVRFQKEADQVYSNFKIHDEPLWKQEVFELFVCDDNHLETYKELQSSPWDVLFDGIISYDKQGKRHLNVSWHAAGWESVSHFDKNNGRLTTVWSIPYDAFDTKPKAGISWRLGVFAVNQNGESQDLLSWQKLGRPNFHLPERFGYLDFE